jgi:hypothetical protein
MLTSAVLVQMTVFIVHHLQIALNAETDFLQVIMENAPAFNFFMEMPVKMILARLNVDWLVLDAYQKTSVLLV